MVADPDTNSNMALPNVKTEILVEKEEEKETEKKEMRSVTSWEK
jgi:hypothetical protein